MGQASRRLNQGNKLMKFWEQISFNEMTFPENKGQSRAESLIPISVIRGRLCTPFATFIKSKRRSSQHRPPMNELDFN